MNLTRKRPPSPQDAPPKQLTMDLPIRTRPHRPWKDQPVRTRCTNCSTPITVPQWYFEQGLKLHFCSDQCREAWHGGLLSDSFPGIQLDGRPDYRGGNWEIQAKQARERDAYTCQRCGITERELGRPLDVHHKLPYRAFNSPAEANRLSNLVSLCRACHMKVEAEINAALPLLAKSSQP